MAGSIIILLYVAVCALLAVLYGKKYRRMEERLFCFVLCLTLPVFGVLFLLLLDRFYAGRDDGTDAGLDMGEGLMADEFSLLRPIDAQGEMDKVPLYDALKMGEYKFRRHMVVETLKKEDTIEYLEVLKLALDNDDTETSHYASAVIMDIQKKVQEKLLLTEAHFENHPQDTDAMQALEEELYRLMESGIYDRRTLKKYEIRYMMVSDALLALPHPQERWYHHRMCMDFETDNTLHAEALSDRYRADYPDSEDMVVDMIKLCVKMKDRAKLDEFLDHIGKMPVLLTGKSLEYIRFFRNHEPETGHSFRDQEPEAGNSFRNQEPVAGR